MLSVFCYCALAWWVEGIVLEVSVAHNCRLPKEDKEKASYTAGRISKSSIKPKVAGEHARNSSLSDCFYLLFQLAFSQNQEPTWSEDHG